MVRAADPPVPVQGGTHARRTLVMEHAPRLLARHAAAVDRALKESLGDVETVQPRLAEAMRYSIQAGGKRLRPALVLECCALCGGDERNALPAAAAIECVHTFSLIHDDLPAMDNDDLRRGRPTNHKVFGEATAILAGDALLTMAFELLARDVGDADVSRAMALTLARASGGSGMIGGQALDIEGEAQPPAHERIQPIHAMKTAALIAAACRLGGLAARAPARQLDALEAYGRHLGLAFQAVDDLLDVSGDTATLGKTAGKDAAAGKQSLARVVSLEEGWRIAESLAAQAVAALDPFGAPARPLVDLARFVVERHC